MDTEETDRNSSKNKNNVINDNNNTSNSDNNNNNNTSNTNNNNTTSNTNNNNTSNSDNNNTASNNSNNTTSSTTSNNNSNNNNNNNNKSNIINSNKSNTEPTTTTTTITETHSVSTTPTTTTSTPSINNTIINKDKDNDVTTTTTTTTTVKPAIATTDTTTPTITTTTTTISTTTATATTATTTTTTPHPLKPKITFTPLSNPTPQQIPPPTIPSTMYQSPPLTTPTPNFSSLPPIQIPSSPLSTLPNHSTTNQPSKLQPPILDFSSPSPPTTTTPINSPSTTQSISTILPATTQNSTTNNNFPLSTTIPTINEFTTISPTPFTTNPTTTTNNNPTTNTTTTTNTNPPITNSPTSHKNPTNTTTTKNSPTSHTIPTNTTTTTNSPTSHTNYPTTTTKTSPKPLTNYSTTTINTVTTILTINGDPHKATTKRYKQTTKLVTDDCWSWVVLISATYSTTLMGSSFILFALLYNDLVRQFGSSTSAAGWIGSIHVACVNLFGIPFGMAIDVFGCRKVAIFGTLLCNLGFLLSSFANHITTLYFTYGVLSGCGLGMITISSAVEFMRHFDKKRPIAAGIFSFGYSLGSVGIGPLLNLIFEQYSWRGSLIIYSAFVLHMMVAALAFKPQKTIEVMVLCGDEEEEEEDGGGGGYGDEKDLKMLKPLKGTATITTATTTTTTATTTATTTTATTATTATKTTLSKKFAKIRREFFKKLRQCRTVLNDGAFVCYLVAGFLMYIGVQSFGQHMPNRAIVLGIERSKIWYLPMSTNGIAGVTKIIAGFVSNIPGANKILLYSLALLGTGVSQCMIPLCQTFTLIILQGILEGVFIGFIFSLCFIILVDLKGLSNLTVTQPLLTMAFGFGALISTPFTGFLYDTTNDYDVTFLITSGLILLGAIFSFVSVAILKKRKVAEKLARKKLILG